MQFKHPEILYALLLLIIPIIVHLFQLRRFKKEVFTNVAFLKKVTLQTRKSSQLKKWLVLLIRMLLLACVIMAFAQPYFSKKTTFNKKPETVIYLDNSFSMQAKGEQGTLLNRAIQDIIEHTDASETISILTNTATFKNTTLKAITNELLQLPYSSYQLPYEAALIRSKQLFSNQESRSKHLVFISDFQTKNEPFTISNDSMYQTKQVQLKPVNISNINIDSVYISDVSASNTVLKAVIKNSGNTLENVPVSLFDGEQLLAKTSVRLDKEALAEFTITQNQISHGRIEVDDTGLQFDDQFYFNINPTAKINTLVISESETNFLKRIYKSEEFNYSETTLSQLNYSKIDEQNLIILNELETLPSALSNSLNVFIENGGFVIVVPSTKSVINSYNAFLLPYGINMMPLLDNERLLTTIQFDHPLFDHVFDKAVTNFQYPKVNSYFNFTTVKANSPLAFEDGKPFLLESNNVFVFSAALNSNNSNFKQSPLIVPTFYNIARQSLKTPRLYSTVGEPNTFDVKTSLKQDAVLSLKKDDLNLIPQQQYFNNKVTITTNEMPNEAGTYQVMDKTQPIENVSYNFNRTESLLDYQEFDDQVTFTISDSVAEALNEIKSDSKINELWKWFLIFALAFLVLELLILKYFK